MWEDYNSAWLVFKGTCRPLVAFVFFYRTFAKLIGFAVPLACYSKSGKFLSFSFWWHTRWDYISLLGYFQEGSMEGTAPISPHITHKAISANRGASSQNDLSAGRTLLRSQAHG